MFRVGVPGRHVGLAKQTGLIDGLGRWVLATASSGYLFGRPAPLREGLPTQDPALGA